MNFTNSYCCDGGYGYDAGADGVGGWGSGFGFSLSLVPFYDTYSGKYCNILTLNAMPPGPLASMVKRISAPRLSEFSGYDACGGRCLFALTRWPVAGGGGGRCCYMYACDIPAVIGYLENNGYIINNSISRILRHAGLDVDGDGRCGVARPICYFSYSG